MSKLCIYFQFNICLICCQWQTLIGTDYLTCLMQIGICWGFPLNKHTSVIQLFGDIDTWSLIVVVVVVFMLISFFLCLSLKILFFFVVYEILRSILGSYMYFCPRFLSWFAHCELVYNKLFWLMGTICASKMTLRIIFTFINNCHTAVTAYHTNTNCYY